MRVNFVWNGRNPHDVVFPPASGLPSMAIQTTGSFNVTPSATGTFPFQCTVHPGMTGTLIVR
jgi:plastocyanin